jgi:hypothetical protein
MSHPIQELHTNGKINLNTIAGEEFPDEDREQFAQLIGYSLSGFGGLSYVSDVTYYRAETIRENDMTQQDAEILALKQRVEDLESAMSKVKELTEEVIRVDI